MSWFTPPPLIDKPVPPGPPLPRPKRQGIVYAVGIALWLLVTHALWFGLLLARYLLARPMEFFPSWFWAGEALTLAAGVVLGGILSLRLLMYVQHVGVEQGWKPEEE